MNRNSVTVGHAVAILGKKGVVAQGESSRLWNIEWSDGLLVPYNYETICDCAITNQEGEADWRLVYINGFSLREQRERIGVNWKNSLHFAAKYNDWWLKVEEDYWAEQKPKEGYYLIDFMGRFEFYNWPDLYQGCTWGQQEERIAAMDSRCERVHEAVLLEAACSVFIAFGGKWPLSHYHWGKAITSHGYGIKVGCSFSGLEIWQAHRECNTGGIRAYRSWKRDVACETPLDS